MAFFVAKIHAETNQEYINFWNTTSSCFNEKNKNSNLSISPAFVTIKLFIYDTGYGFVTLLIVAKLLKV